MARQHRDFSTSSVFHILNRGADRQDIFSGPEDHQLFEHLVGDELVDHHIGVHAYALMSNHFHLLIECHGGDISAAIRRLCSRYGAAYNQRSGRSGPVINDRFHSVPVESDAQFRTAARYIHRNPIPIVGVKNLPSYRWSSLPALLGRARPAQSWLTHGVVISDGEEPEEYLRFVTTPVPSDIRPGAWSEPIRLPIDTIEWIVANVADVGIDDLRGARSKPAWEARMLCITLLLELRVESVEGLARWFGLRRPESVRRIARKGRVKAHRDPAFGALRERVLDDLGRRHADHARSA